MKISQTLVRQEITPSTKRLNWFENSDHYWLQIASGLIVIKELDGRIRLLVENKLDEFGRGRLSGSLYNATSGTTCPILPGDHLNIELNPQDSYVLIITNHNHDHGKQFISTWTLEFSPDTFEEI